MNTVDKLSGVIASIVGLAMLAVLVSSKAKTASVIQAAGTGFSQVIKSAIAPIS